MSYLKLQLSQLTENDIFVLGEKGVCTGTDGAEDGADFHPFMWSVRKHLWST